MKLGALILMAREAHFRLGELVQHFLIGVVDLMAIGARDSVRLMLATRPVRPRKNA
jgi:hypothetical protein